MKTNYILVLTNASKSQWSYCVKAGNPTAALAAAKKLHNPTTGMPRLTLVSCEIDTRPYLQRCQEEASRLVKLGENSDLYRYGPMLDDADNPMHEVAVQYVKSRTDLMWATIFERMMQAEFEDQLASARKEYREQKKA